MSCPQTMASIEPVLGTCAFRPGQTYKIFFQKIYSAEGVKNGVLLADADDVAEFSPFLAAADETRIVATDKIGGGKVTPGAVKEFGGGNETPGGSPIAIGKGTSKFEGKMFMTLQSAIKELKKLEDVSGLGVYFVSHNDKITGKVEAIEAADTLVPIPIEQYPYFQDLEMGELETPVSNMLGFYLPENWSDDIQTVDCAGIKDLVNTSTP